MQNKSVGVNAWAIMAILLLAYMKSLPMHYSPSLPPNLTTNYPPVNKTSYNLQKPCKYLHITIRYVDLIQV